MQQFRDKVAVITGAGRGIGRGIAERCAREGMKVVLAGIGRRWRVSRSRRCAPEGLRDDRADAFALAIAGVARRPDVGTSVMVEPADPLAVYDRGRW